MGSQGFSFPPPPPPPKQPTLPACPPPSQIGQNYTQRGGDRRGQQSGYGRGYGKRGAGRGVHFGPPDMSHPQPHSAGTSTSYAQMSYGRYAAQGLPTHTPGSMPASASQYTQSQHLNFHHALNVPGFNGQPFSATTLHMRSSPHQNRHQAGYDSYSHMANIQHPMSLYPSQAAPTYTATSHQHIQQPSQAALMGPPMHWNFDRPGNAGTYSREQYGNAGFSGSYNAHLNQKQAGRKSTKYPMKRDYSSAFEKTQSIGQQTPAPPAVPNFYNSLPSKPPPTDPARKPKKKKRKHNQLGLTPKIEEHESSEEDDLDEESKLAKGPSDPAVAMKFTYKGRTSTLQSPADIAAWIEERKSRFPTRARIEEKKKAMEEAKKVREETARQRELRNRESGRQKEHRGSNDAGKCRYRESQENQSDPLNAAAKAKLKAEKLRRKLIKEEKRIAKAEADAERARLETELHQRDTAESTKDISDSDLTTQDIGRAGQHNAPKKLAADEEEVVCEPMTEPDKLEASTIAPQLRESAVRRAMEVEANRTSSSDFSDISDWTSSSGSDLSSSDPSGSDSSSESDVPEKMSSHHAGPERVAPPPQEVKEGKLCRHFVRNGRCFRKEQCRFLHEMPERKAKLPSERKRRKGLLQALLDQQKEEENRRIMDVIMTLGVSGALEPAKNENG